MRKKLYYLITLLPLLLIACSDDDNGKPDPVDVYTSIPKANGIYYGDLLENGNGNYTLDLFSGELDSDGNLSGEGFAVKFDFFSLLADDPDNATPESVEYTQASSGAESTFLPGQYNAGTSEYEGSVYIISNSAGDITIDPITNGSFEISRQGNTYTILTDITTDGGESLKYRYTGIITFRNEVKEHIAVTNAEGIYYGDRLGNGNGNYTLDLYSGELDGDGNLSGEGFAVKLDFFSLLADDPDNAAPESVEYAQASSGAESTFLPGQYNAETGEYEGAVYIESDDAGTITVDPVDGGTFEISRQGNTYTIVTNLTTNGGKTLKYEYAGIIIFENQAVEPAPTYDIENVLGFYMDVYFSINYDLHLYAGEIDENMDIVGDGFRIFFECFSPDMYNGEYQMPPGLYNAADGADMEDWAFARGEHNGDTLRSSQLREYKDSQLTATAIVDGTLKVERTGDVYTIIIDVVCEDGRILQTSYEGAIGFENMVD